MNIFFSDTDTTPGLVIAVNDNSYRYRKIKGEHNLTLYFSLAQHVEIPVGAWCSFEGERYELVKPGNFKKHNTRNFEYTLIMEAQQAKLCRYKFKNTVDRRLKFSYTARPHEHLQMLVDNMNLRDSGWSAGECIDAVEKVISYNHAFCAEALTQMADAFETEYEIIGKQIHLHKVEYDKSNPLPLSYGKGNGFKPGIGRTSYNESKPVEVLHVQGGERNIDPSKYGSRELLLPKNQTLEYEGRNYISDADGFSIRRADKPLASHEEDSLDCSYIYPKRVGNISKVEVVDAAKNFYDFIDNTIPADLNYGDCIIEGETMTVIFQSGMLAGKEFEVKYKHAEKRFEIVPQEIDGVTMPNSSFQPVAGQDTYAVFNILLPDAYVCNNAAKSGASWDMFREAAKYLYENEEQKFTFTGELDGVWAKRDWLNIGGKIRLGGYILFSDTQFQPEGVAIRIVGIKDYINKPHNPEIELSNQTIGSSFSSTLGKIEENEVVMEDNRKEALQFTKRRFRDAKETMSMLEAAMLNNFSQSISPISVQTMAMLVGDKSLQFRFVDRKYVEEEPAPQQVQHNVIYDAATKVLTVPAGILQHMTLEINSVSASHSPSEYLFWGLPEFNTPPLTETDKKYYLYAKVHKTDDAGEFRLSETAVGIEAEEGYYHLLMGILNTEYNDERSYVSLYGFTEVLPGQITTDTIKSSDGSTYFDLLKGEIGGNIKFYAGEKDGTRLYSEAISGSTDILGGLVLGNLMFVKDSQNRIRVGMSGLSDDQVAFFADEENAYESAKRYLEWVKNPGSGQKPYRPNFIVDDAGKCYFGAVDIETNSPNSLLSVSGEDFTGMENLPEEEYHSISGDNRYTMEEYTGSYIDVGSRQGLNNGAFRVVVDKSTQSKMKNFYVPHMVSELSLSVGVVFNTFKKLSENAIYGFTGMVSIFRDNGSFVKRKYLGKLSNYSYIGGYSKIYSEVSFSASDFVGGGYFYLEMEFSGTMNDISSGNATYTVGSPTLTDDINNPVIATGEFQYCLYGTKLSIHPNAIALLQTKRRGFYVKLLPVEFDDLGFTDSKSSLEIVAKGLPISASGLKSGQIYVSNNTLMIVP